MWSGKPTPGAALMNLRFRDERGPAAGFASPDASTAGSFAAGGSGRPPAPVRLCHLPHTIVVVLVRKHSLTYLISGRLRARWASLCGGVLASGLPSCSLVGVPSVLAGMGAGRKFCSRVAQGEAIAFTMDGQGSRVESAGDGFQQSSMYMKWCAWAVDKSYKGHAARRADGRGGVRAESLAARHVWRGFHLPALRVGAR